MCKACGTWSKGNLCGKCLKRKQRSQKRLQLTENNCDLCQKTQKQTELTIIQNEWKTAHLLLCQDCLQKIIPPSEPPTTGRHCIICKKEFSRDKEGGNKICASCRVLRSRLKNRLVKSGGLTKCWRCQTEYDFSVLNPIFNEGKTNCILVCSECLIKIKGDTYEKSTLDNFTK